MSGERPGIPPVEDAPSVIIFPSGAVIAGNDGGPIRVTVEGGGFTDAERAAIVADLLAGRIMPGDVPPGDGSKIMVTFSGCRGAGHVVSGSTAGDPAWRQDQVSHQSHVGVPPV